MGRGCNEPGCTGKHRAKGKCGYHYRMPSHTPPEAETEKPATTKKKPKGKQVTESLPDLLKRAEKVFNAWIRKRDLLPDNTFKCISCGLFRRRSEMDAGHFYPKTYSFIRFDPDNVHGECINCNRLDDKHLEQYKLNLEDKIGWTRLERLSFIKNVPFKWDRQDLLNIIENYK